MADGHKDLTTKVVRIWEGPEIVIISADDAKSKGLHPSRRIDPDTIQPRAPIMSYWKARSKTALDKAKKRILEGMTGDKPAAINDESDESSDEEAASTHKTPLSTRFSNCNCDLYCCQSAPSIWRRRTMRRTLPQFQFQLHPYAQATMSSTKYGER